MQLRRAQIADAKQRRVMRASHACFRALAGCFLRTDEASLDAHSHRSGETILR